VSRLSEGDLAPGFDVVDTSGDRIVLDDLRGRRVYLAFHRFASCPFCNLRVHHLIEAHDALRDAGLAVITFFQTPSELIAGAVGRQRPPFPIVGDPDMQVYARYGVERSATAMLGAARRPGDLASAMTKGFAPRRVDGDPRLVPAHFLVDEIGIIRVAYYGRDIGDHLPLDTIAGFAAQEAAAK